jgi:glycine cleavage system H protein
MIELGDNLVFRLPKLRMSMAFEYPEDLKYLDSHEYARLDGEIATIGITAFAVDQLGDIVFLELPDVGEALKKGETFGSVESVKAVEDLVAPIAGTVIERNEALIEAPEQLAEDPYGEGWMLKIRIDDEDDLNDTLSAEEYRIQVEGE